MKKITTALLLSLTLATTAFAVDTINKNNGEACTNHAECTSGNCNKEGKCEASAH